MSENDIKSEVGHLVLSAKEHRDKYAVVSMRLNRIGGTLSRVGAALQALDSEANIYEGKNGEAANEIRQIEADILTGKLTDLLREHMELHSQMSEDARQLKKLGL